MANLTDSKLVEILVVLKALVLIAVDGADIRHPHTVEAANLLHAAITEAISSVPFERNLKLQARSKRVLLGLQEPFVSRNFMVSAFGLAFYCLLRRIVETDYFVFGPESECARALARLLPALEYAVTDERLTRAERNAETMLASLQAENFFKGLREREASNA